MKCDCCGAPAEFNVQKLWVLWKLKNGNYLEPKILYGVEEPVGDENLYLCGKCFADQKFLCKE